MRSARQAGQARDGLAVGAGVEPRLHRLPVGGAERAGERGGEDRLADVGVGAGDDDARIFHRSASASAASSRSIVGLVHVQRQR